MTAFSSYNPNIIEPDSRDRQAQRMQVCQHFNHHIRILIPSTVAVDIPTDTTAWVERGNRLFCELFGGSQCKQYLGLYQSEASGVVTETVFEIEAWTTDLGLKQAETALEHFLFELLEELQQETIFVTVDGTAKLLQLASFPPSA